jgi:hypothetical protein
VIARNYIDALDVIKTLEKKHSCCLNFAGFLFGLLFDPEDEGRTFLRNVG